nr:zinc finger, CCHC-type, retrotransposon Gag domain protein [Tanacetum cinerariifolium]
MVSEPGYETVGSKDLTCEDWIHAKIREEFRTGSGPSGSGGNPPPICHMEKIFDVMGYEDAFKTRLAVYKFKGDALAWWKAYKQAKGGDVWLITVPRSSCWYCGGAGKELLAGLRKSTLNHLMCIPFTDVAQVANAAR